MVTFAELLGEEIREKKDEILPLIKDMKTCSANQEFEQANELLKMIWLELDESDWDDGGKQTIKDMYMLLRSSVIRLNPSLFQGGSYIELLKHLLTRKSELQGSRYINIENQRRIIAEEMADIGMVIPRKKRGMCKMPNRKFLEIAFKVNPSICNGELVRREGVNLWNRIKNGSNVEETKEKIREFKNF